ncbi:hypothetical protein C5B42_03695 [Candidatus Cerribacteria bacterium 'Amazon FNV 2010 28 9']|uniref:Uncharacterized protein n=1 Tax=Candidatus Cerribacteria bacterium 'Amazon FNV 2010 28 9' TaxID=2081795 RepID=A0A317JTI6_9BACT|nr:MAG: hypothetical protein C5B42_03695 [Candidatus Cerribacteria bacterium 'Amazon FNV 2010 28 9']
MDEENEVILYFQEFKSDDDHASYDSDVGVAGICLQLISFLELLLSSLSKDDRSLLHTQLSRTQVNDIFSVHNIRV